MAACIVHPFTTILHIAMLAILGLTLSIHCPRETTASPYYVAALLLASLCCIGCWLMLADGYSPCTTILVNSYCILQCILSLDSLGYSPPCHYISQLIPMMHIHLCTTISVNSYHLPQHLLSLDSFSQSTAPGK